MIKVCNVSVAMFVFSNPLVSTKLPSDGIHKHNILAVECGEKWKKDVEAWTVGDTCRLYFASCSCQACNNLLYHATRAPLRSCRQIGNRDCRLCHRYSSCIFSIISPSPRALVNAWWARCLTEPTDLAYPACRLRRRGDYDAIPKRKESKCRVRPRLEREVVASR